MNLRKAFFISLACGIAGISHAQGLPQSAPATQVDYIHMLFRGRYRAAAKTHYARSPKGQLVRTEMFPDLEALQETLPADAWMRHTYADRLSSPKRFPEERRNVSVGAYLHAVMLENGIDAHGNRGDLDFDVILGTSPKHGEGRFFAARVSALPKDAADEATFIAAREQLLQLLLDVAHVPQRQFNAAFAEINPPLKVRVTGSLLFDGRDASGQSGPDYAKATSAWRIDPVMAIDQQ